ncbi:MAG: zf-HC2 domain-containing protein [Candidatus Eremiobacteraeota bacterium]|nr:zf-HC2 domain-containing protein [Candidatus Eremiobacteraeota bacterium]MBV8365022.1 zf-HC2 domain-containing protein [Candidatus Eremiobacteraeota bacterium]
MNCSACEARLAAYLDGELSARDAQAIEAHMNSCASCRVLVNDLRAVEIKLQGLRGVEPRPGFDVAVMAAIAALPVPKPARLRLRWFVAYVAAAWAVLITLTVARVIDWQHAFAAVAIELGKVAAAGSTVLGVGLRLHLTTFVGAGIGIEMLVLLVGAFALRRFYPQMRGWFAGAPA